ncbi:hypothetical protein BH10BAC3_BH10BAC3_12720 [soil metagenome]
MKINTFRVRGEEQSASSNIGETDQLELKNVYIIGSAARGEVVTHEIKLSDSDIVEFEFEDGTVWISSPETIGEVFQDASQQMRGVINDTGIFEIPTGLYHPEQERGIFNKVILKIIRVFGKKNVVKPLVRELALKLEEKLLGVNRGLRKVTKDFQLQEATVQNEGLYLLFLHGTAASAENSFGKLTKDTRVPTWKSIIDKYGENVLAFQYESLTKSPLQNVADLVNQLPQQVTLHIISQSGGGLVGDILNRFCIEDASQTGFSAEEKNYLGKQNRQADVVLIEAIEVAIREKNITIEKYIRVACPASGSSLATKRLDHLLNTLLNVLGFATGIGTLPVYIAFKDLIAGVLETKSNPEILPGIEVLSPLSPINKMLNNGNPMADIQTPLIVIAGESQVTMRFNALFIILTKMYYLGSNDFIVNTKSMFNGAKRAGGRVQYFLDKGPNVNHFSYYENDTTKSALQQAILNNGETLIPGFSLLSQRSFTDEEVRFLGLEGGKLIRDKVTGKRPIAVLLPGIMGSNLSVKETPVWINYFSFLRGGLMQLTFSEANNANIKPGSVIKTSYEKLAIFLNDKYDVITFPFDWRLQLNVCAKALNAKLIELMEYGQPIKLVGHSMGGVLVRDFIINHPDTWKKINGSKDFRLLFLGSPLGGSFRIPYVLFGKDDIINKLAMIDIFNTKKQLLQMFSKLPGILSLLPIRTDTNQDGNSYDFAEASTWANMKTAFGDDSWPVPGDNELKEFRGYRDKILEKSDTIDYSNAIYIAGQVSRNKDTPSGYRITDGKLEFLSTKEGDESVTWDSGIPAKMITDGTVYYSDVTHGELANEVRLFNAISEILADGKTSLLKKTKPAVRSFEKEFIAREIYDFDFSKEGVENTILGLDNEVAFDEGKMPINVSVINGDLKYASYPVMVGHFYKDGILYAEKDIDSYLHKELSNRHKLGLYPGEIGTSEILISEGMDGFKGAIITGLGLQGELTANSLMRTVEQAVSKYLTGFNSEIANGFSVLASQKQIGISTLVIGCGYGGLGIENAVRAIIQGVQNANDRIRQIYTSARTVDVVEFVELYRDIALATVHALNNIEKDENRTLSVAWAKSKIKKQLGWRERLPSESTNEWWTRITVRKNSNIIDGTGNRGLRFTISTNAAREQERFLGADSETVKQLLEEISIKNSWSPEIAKAFFELLIPNDFKDQVKRQGNLNWILDKDTASFPWELLQDSASKTLPLCVNAGMIRQLATKDFRIKINQVIENNALVIGDPDLKNPAMQLPGALKEGEKAYEVLQGAGYETNKLLNASAAQIMLALFSKSYKIVHLAGHGAFNPDPEKPSGMLIGKDAFLTTFEVSQMSDVPELVFVNCCYLGQMNADTESYYQDRYKLAANIGTELIEIGVKAVIVAGWAVDDSAALDFMTRFYQCMLAGENFGTATRKARKDIYELYSYRSNTWGAYQCYGDPFYTLHTTDKPWPEKYEFVIAEEAEMELGNLLNQLDTSVYDASKTAMRIEKIVEAVDKAGIRNGKITEYEALLYSALNMYSEAIKRFEKLMAEEQAVFSYAATEKYCNVRAKYYTHEIKKNGKKPAEFDDLMKKVIDDLKGMISFCSSVERLNILASTYKRYALVNTGKKKQKAYSDSALNYFLAFTNQANKAKYYSLTNWLAIENALVLAGLRKWGDVIDESKNYILPANKSEASLLLKNELKSQEENAGDDISYWSLAAEANIKLCLLQLGDKDTSEQSVLDAYTRLWNYAGNQGNRAAEIEQFDFLEDALGLAESDKGRGLSKKILSIKSLLQGML